MKIKFEGEDSGDAVSHRRFLRVLERWKQSIDAYAVQSIFVYENIAEFFGLFEKRYLQKILEDIHYILAKRWAFEIAEDDFYHGHVCGKSKTAIRDLDALLSPSNVCFLYHTFEQKSWMQEAINRNIISYPKANPIVVHPKYKFGTRPHYGVASRDLGLMEYARIFFTKTPEGPYSLKDKTKIDLWGKFF